MKKIHITESQLEELKQKLNEITINGDDELSNGDLDTAANAAVNKATRDGVPVNSAPVSVSFSHDALKKKGITSESITKRQIKAAKLKKLQESCIVFRKSDLS